MAVSVNCGGSCSTALLFGVDTGASDDWQIPCKLWSIFLVSPRDIDAVEGLS